MSNFTRIVFTVVALLVCSKQTSAQDLFGPERIIIQPEVPGASSVHAADLDGDGDMDVLSASEEDGKIAWYENTDGQSTFGPQKIITTDTSGPLSVHAADLDGDGDIDVLSASQHDDKIAWYENTDGLGGFGPQQVITRSAEGARSVFTADLDGDGDIDVLSGAYGGNQVAWYENVNGLGFFGSPQVIVSNEVAVSSVHAADLDGDGDLDVLYAAAFGLFFWHENTDGKGAFGPPQIITTHEGGLYLETASVYVTDIDGDGDMDVLSASTGRFDDEIAWSENTDGKGSFGPKQVIDASDGAESLFAADLDGDGDMDVLSAFGSDIVWYENTDGLGAFGLRRRITIGNFTFGDWINLARDAKSVFAADLDSDGDMDVLFASSYPVSRGGSKIAWYENTDGHGAFGLQQVITRSVFSPISINSSDLDGDGDVDVLSASRDDHKIAWHKNTDGMGSFEPQVAITIATSSPTSVNAADLDGDGNMDVLSTSWNGDEIAWHKNTNGMGAFGPQQVIVTTPALSVAPADLDGDGDMDISYAVPSKSSAFARIVAWHENTDGLGTFGPQQVIATDEIDFVYATDLDSDGDMDLYALQRFGNVSWYENTDGLGTFGPQQVITTDATVTVYAADLDSDGDLDLASATRGWKIGWYENTDGEGSFGPHQVFITATLITPSSVFAADLDGDGDEDVLAASLNNNDIVWFNNTDGQGSFGPQRNLGRVFGGVSSLLATDLDGDGDMDVLAASEHSDAIVWFENMSSITTLNEPPTVKSEFALLANYPNPFNPETVIRYQLARAAAVKLEIYNLVGQKIATLVNGNQSRGAHSVAWHGSDSSGRPQASGVYIYRLQTDHFVESKKMLLLR